MDPRLLTNTEAKALANSGLGVYLSAEYLTTRTALYERDPQSQRWLRLQSGLCISHCTTIDGRGLRWKQPARRFEPCTCKKCTR